MSLVDGVGLAVCAAILSNLVLFGVGSRLTKSPWPLSLGFLCAVTAVSTAIEGQVAGHRLSIVAPLIAALLVGGPVVFAFKQWNPAGHAAFAATTAAAMAYIAYAGSILIKSQFDLWSMAFGILLLLLQTATLGLLIGTIFETVDVICRTEWSGPGGKNRSGSAPKVSIHVPIHSEPPELVIDTLNALSQLTYSNFEVLVIDNNTDDECLWKPVEAHCAMLGERFRFFHLLPWPGYKSGALNFAIGQTASDAELIAVVDADYVVEPTFLCDLTGHFDDPKVAFVQTPQDYRDGDARGRYGRALYRAYMYFFRISMPSRNETNSIIYAGTMGLIRKSALAEVGGWSEWCITEDAELSLRLLAAGHRSVYVGETYGRGLMPLDLAGLKKQRFRWAFGGMQLLRLHFNTLLSPTSPLSFAQRFGFINGGLQWLNDLLAIVYTTVLLIGAGSFLSGGSMFHNVVTRTMLMTSPIFLMLSMARFLWAFRVRTQCGWREAADAMSVLIGLTWVVGLACARGLLSNQGVFLRTPKQAQKLYFWDAVRIVRVEAALAALCLAGAVGVALIHIHGDGLARGVTVGLLAWQAATFLAAVRLSAWSHSQPTPSPRRFASAAQAHLETPADLAETPVKYNAISRRQLSVDHTTLESIL